MRLPNLWKSRLTNFTPDRQAARPLIKRRLQLYCIVISLVAVLEVITLLLVWFLNTQQNASLVGLALVVGHLLLTFICFGFLDMGPAKIMKRNKFKSNNVKTSLAAMHTFYYVLRISGGYRLLFNGLVTALIAVVAILAYVI